MLPGVGLIGVSVAGVSVSLRWLGAAFCSGKPLFISVFGGNGDGLAALLAALGSDANSIRINAHQVLNRFMESQRME